MSWKDLDSGPFIITSSGFDELVTENKFIKHKVGEIFSRNKNISDHSVIFT